MATKRNHRGRKIPEVLTDQERVALLYQPNPRAPTGLRNLCLLVLMSNLGLRASEALHLRTRDLDWTSGKLTVKNGKGGKDRVLWLNTDDLVLIQRWREKRPVSADLLFTTLKGRRLSDRYLRAMVKRLGLKAGLSKDLHPHLLRHTFATDLYRATRNIRLVQKALGHADLSTTMIYTHIVDAELEGALRTLRNEHEGA